MEPEGSLPHSQVPATCPYSGPDRFSPYPHIPLPEDPSYLSSHLRLGLPSGLFPSGFLTKTLYTPLLFPIRATCPARLIPLDFITRTILGAEYRSLSSSLCILIRNEEITDLYLHYSHHFISAVFRPSKGHIQEVRLTYFHNKIYKHVPYVKFS